MTGKQRLRAEVEAAVLAELERVGPRAFARSAIWRRFERRGAGRSTIYRWMDALLKSGRAGQHLSRIIGDAVAARVSTTDDPAAAVATAAAAALSKVVRLQDIAQSGGIVPVLEKLEMCIRTAEQVASYARTPDGRVRNAKMLLAANERIRRNLVTLVTIRQTVLDLAQLERFHEAVLDVLREETPELAERVVMRLRQLSAQWSTALS